MSEKVAYRSMLIEEMFRKIPKATVDAIMKDIKGALLPSGNFVRRQPCLPVEVYVVLAAYGALGTSEADFFTRVCCEWIERKAIEFGLTNILRQHNEGRAA